MKFTHQGFVVGNNACAPEGHKRKVKLRETKTQWIEPSGFKWSKKLDGLPVGSYQGGMSNWPSYRLDIKSIQLNDNA